MTQLPTTTNIEISGKVNLTDIVEMLLFEHEQSVNTEIQDIKKQRRELYSKKSPTTELEKLIKQHLLSVIHIEVNPMDSNFTISTTKDNRWSDNLTVDLGRIKGTKNHQELKSIQLIKRKIKTLDNKIEKLEREISKDAKKRIRASLTRNVLGNSDSGQQLLELIKGVASQPLIENKG